MLDRCARAKPDRTLGYPLGHLEGDKFGSVHTGASSAYDIMEQHGVYVNHPKTADRQDLVQEGITWTVKLKIDSEIAHIRPKARYIAPPPKSPTRLIGGTGFSPLRPMPCSAPDREM